MNNAFAYSRDQEVEMAGQFTRRLQGASLSILRFMVIHANHSPGQYAGHPVARGEIAAALPHIETMTGLSKKTIRNGLEQLKKRQLIRKKGALKGAAGTALYVIANYEDWDALSEHGQANGQTRGRPGAASKEEERRKDKESDKSLSRPSRKKSLHTLTQKYPQATQIIQDRWLPHAPLPASIEKSESAQAHILDTLRLIHERGNVSWDTIGDVVEYAARNWHPAGYCESPASLYGWTRDKTCRRYEKIQRQMTTASPFTPSSPTDDRSLEALYTEKRNCL
jgi:hypothetical protein